MDADTERRDIVERLLQPMSNDPSAVQRERYLAAQEITRLRAQPSPRALEKALHGLNVAIDEMWNDVHRFQHWSAHQQLICAAQQAAATALAEKHAKEDGHEPE